MIKTFEDNVREKVIEQLIKAENTWNKVKEDLEKGQKYFTFLESTVPSKIPGHPLLKEGKPEVGDFIALVLDIRGSTNHLLQSITGRTTSVSQLQRVLYETTAINTCGIEIINKNEGSITEFLGDGFLALFKADKETDVYKVNNAAKDCLFAVSNIVNPILKERYNLPELKVGIGLGYSKAIITIIGNGNDMHPKALGECVYRASKLSYGINEIIIDHKLKLFWPKKSGGTIKFLLSQNKKRSGDIDGYKISYNNK